MKEKTDQLGEALLREGIITENHLQHALQVQQDSLERKRLGQILVELAYITKRQLRDISSDRITGLGPNKVKSVPDAIAIAFERWLQEKNGIQQELMPTADAGQVPVREAVVQAGGELLERRPPEQDFIGACPDCGSQLAFVEGCAKCHVCGYSECG